jgi:hypothetical protein
MTSYILCKAIDITKIKRKKRVLFGGHGVQAFYKSIATQESWISAVSHEVTPRPAAASRLYQVYYVAWNRENLAFLLHAASGLVNCEEPNNAYYVTMTSALLAKRE